MKKKTVTKHALLASVLAMVLCVTMLVGTTFAWFTDTASANVNKIQSGKLDVALEMKTTKDGKETWVSAEGETLTFKTFDGREADKILWEPGCTYELPALRVVNNGNLNLKYKVIISGINGDAKLNKVIKWTMNDADIATTEKTLKPKENSGELVIKGHMDEAAGNEYQNLTIDGVAVTVYATQVEGEYDSSRNDYDKGATYPVEIVPSVETNMTPNASTTEEGKVDNYTYSNTDNTLSAVYTPNTKPNTTDTAPTLTVTPTSKTAGGVTIEAASQDAVAYDISLKKGDDVLQNTGLTKVTIKVGAGLKNVVVYHNNTAMEAVSSEEEVVDGKFYYDAAAGTVTLATSSFSPFTVVFDSPVAVVNGVSYYDFTSALKAGGTVVLLKDTSIATFPSFTNGETVVLDLNEKTLSITINEAVNIKNSSSLTVKNGEFHCSSNATGAAFMIHAGSSMVLENAKLVTAGSGLFPAGDAAKLEIINSSIEAGVYGIGTNAATTGNYNVVINIKGSTVTSSSSSGDNTALYVNVPCTLNIEDSTITADRQGMFVRGGTASIKNTTIETTGKYKDDKTYLTGNWNSGNELPCGALVLGNSSKSDATSYPYATDCTLTNVKLVAGNGVRTLYIDSNDAIKQKVTLTYDADSVVGEIVRGNGKNIVVNKPN